MPLSPSIQGIRDRVYYCTFRLDYDKIIQFQEFSNHAVLVWEQKCENPEFGEHESPLQDLPKSLIKNMVIVLENVNAEEMDPGK